MDAVNEVLVLVTAACGAIVGSGIGVIIAERQNQRLEKNEPESIILEPGTGSLKEHVYIEPVKKKTVFRDKYIEAEEQNQKS